MTNIKIILILFFFSFDITAQTDTLNFIDANNKKQGYWIILGKNKPGTCFLAEQKIEEGKYLNNRKSGVWTEYYCNGKMKNELTFIDGRPNGPAKMYYENGQLKEEGVWEINKWVGEHKKYTEDGKIDDSPDNPYKEFTKKDPIKYPRLNDSLDLEDKKHK